MTQAWTDFLSSRGATFDGGVPANFGDGTAELAAATGEVMADLSHLGLIAFSGEDTGNFLQGQVTSDVRQLRPVRAQYSGCCTPKGRMLANFLLFRTGDDVLMQLPADLQTFIQKRFSMFILRSKVKPRDARDEVVRLGVAGPDAAARVRSIGATLPEADLGISEAGGMYVIRFSPTRFQIVAPVERGPELWDRLSANTRPVGYPVWQWLEIRAGVPTIVPATQEQFVPQMVNYELVGGVSFQKGCYPGQEIVARTQYLGKVKRRMYLAHVEGADAGAGDELFTPDMEGQVTGMVVNASPAPTGGYDLLAVIQQSSAEAHPVHLKSTAGAVLKLEPLPYTVT